MRKRSEIGKKATTKVEDIGGTKIGFVECSHCGIEQSVGTLEKRGGKCIACGEDLSEETTEAKEKTGSQKTGMRIPVSETKAKHKPASELSTASGDKLHILPDATAAICSVCGKYQFATDSGPVCNNGHGGAASMHTKEWEKYCVDRAIEKGKKEAEAKKQIADMPKPALPFSGKVTREQVKASIEKVFAVDDDAGEEVTVTWAEEMIQVVSFCHYRHGPFSATSRIRPGETRALACARVYAELADFAESSRIDKHNAYCAALAKATKVVGERG